MGHGASNVTAKIAELQAADKYLVKPGDGNDTELPEAGNRIGQVPTGHTSTHAALNDARYD